jgi:hypothetical protein
MFVVIKSRKANQILGYSKFFSGKYMKRMQTTEKKLNAWLDEFVTERKMWIATFITTAFALISWPVELALLTLVVMAGITIYYRKSIGFGPSKNKHNSKNTNA